MIQDHPEVEAAWAEYIQHRVELKNPLTPTAAKRALHKVAELSMGNPRRAVSIINQSIESNWLGIFPLTRENEQRFLARERAISKSTPEIPLELQPTHCHDCEGVFPNRAEWEKHKCVVPGKPVPGDPVKYLTDKWRMPKVN